MDYRLLGTTGLTVSALGFGCGAVGGMLINGTPRERREIVAHAIECGITYFDTASAYGDGVSETNLGIALKEVGTDVIVGTKVRLAGDDFERIEAAVVQSVDTSLKRLQRDQIDLIQLHNPIALQRRVERQWASIDDVALVVETFRRLHRQGKVRCWGINGLGESPALHRALDLGAQTIQSCYNLINPTAGMPAPHGFAFQDYGQLIDRAAERQIGVIAIRVLAAGALSGSADRHPNAAQSVEPIATGRSFADDVVWARRFEALIAAGYAGSLAEAALRFALSKPELATALIGVSSMEQLEQALHAAEQGALPAQAYHLLQEIWRIA